MSRYKFVLFLCVFIIACKNDAPASTTPTVAKTLPPVEPIRPQVEVSKPAPLKKEDNGLVDLSYISGCQNVEMDRCNFNGGGTYGIYINNVENMKVNSCKITKCTNGALRINNSKGINFINSTFSNNFCKIPVVNFYSTGSSVSFNNVTISNNKKDPSSTFTDSDRLFAVGNNTIQLKNCVIQNNTGYKYLGVNPGNIRKSQIEGVSIP